MRVSVRTWSDEQFIAAVAASTSWPQVARALGVSHNGAEYYQAHARRLGVSWSHFPYRKNGRPQTYEEKLSANLARYHARRDAFFAQRGNACEQCGGAPSAIMWKDRAEERTIRWLMGQDARTRARLLRTCVALCKECFLDMQHDGRKHGIPTRYKYGCRCDECRKASADKQYVENRRKYGPATRPRWKYDRLLVPVPLRDEMHLWELDTPSPEGWWTTLARDTVDEAPEVHPEPSLPTAPEE